MDFEEREKLKRKRKLVTTANKIRKNRQNFKKIKEEAEAFEQIKELLNEDEILSVEDEPVAVEVVHDTFSFSTSTIPISTPGIEIFFKDKTFSLFNEKTLCLKDFLNKDEKFGVFGNDCEEPDEGLFRRLIVYNKENISPDNEKCHSTCLYVLYLLSVHPDRCFLRACLDFLKYRHCLISTAEILPILINFGSTPEILIGSDVAVDLPKKLKRHVKKGSNEDICFPYHNFEMVGNAILYFAKLGLIRKDPELKLLLKALTRLTLDPKIRSSRYFALYSFLISVLSTQLKVNVAVSSLHLRDEHLLNQLEIVRTVLMPISSNLREALIVKIINFILKSNTLRVSLKIKDVVRVLNVLVKKEMPILDVYCILQLINSSLPSVTATATEAVDVNNALACLEAGFHSAKDSVDLIRLKLEIAKLRCLVVNNLDKRSMLNHVEGLELSSE